LIGRITGGGGKSGNWTKDDLGRAWEGRGERRDRTKSLTSFLAMIIRKRITLGTVGAKLRKKGQGRGRGVGTREAGELQCQINITT